MLASLHLNEKADMSVTSKVALSLAFNCKIAYYMFLTKTSKFLLRI